MAKQIYTIFSIISLLCIFVLQTTDAQHTASPRTVVKTISYTNKPIEIPAHLSTKEKADRFAKIMGNRLAMSDTQIMRLTVRRIQYLKRMEKLQATVATNPKLNMDSPEIIVEKKKIEGDYKVKFYELLTPEQRQIIRRSNNQLAQK